MLFLLLPIFHHQDRAAGFEWVLINAVTDRGANAGDDDPESRKQSRFGCGVGVA